MINLKDLAVSDRNTDLSRILKAGFMQIILHRNVARKAVLNFSYERLDEVKPNALVWVDGNKDGYLSMMTGWDVSPLPGFISCSGNFDAGGDVIHAVQVTAEHDYIYDGITYDEDHEDIVHKKISENIAKSRKFFLNDISLLTQSEDACSTFACKEVQEIPDGATLCPDVSELEPFDVVYIQHRNGLIACTFQSKFRLIPLKDVRNIIDPTVGSIYLVKETGDIIQIVEEYGEKGALAFWNDDFFSAEDMHYVEDHISNAMLE